MFSGNSSAFSLLATSSPQPIEKDFKLKISSLFENFKRSLTISYPFLRNTLQARIDKSSS